MIRWVSGFESAVELHMSGFMWLGSLMVWMVDGGDGVLV